MPRGLWRFGVVAAAALLPYLLLPSYPLIYDAYPTIVANEALREGPLTHLFAVDFWGRAPDGLSLRSYRPLVSLSYAVQERTVGDWPALYHLTDMVLHATAAVMLLWLLARLGIRREWALLGALLFALHPVQTDSVCSAVGRADILAANCLLGALVLHLGTPGARGPWLRRGGAVLLLAAALLCKEYAVVFPFIIIAIDLARRGKADGPSRSEHRQQTFVWLGALLALGGYLALRYALFGALGGVPLGPEDNPLAGQPVPVRWLNSLSLVAFALRLLVLPYGLNHHYRLGTLPIVEQMGDPRALFGLALLLALLAFAAAARLRWRDSIPIVVLALVLLPLAPSLNTVSLAGVLFAERFLYIPTAGLALGVVWVLQHLKQGSSPHQAVRWAFVGVLLVFGSLTAWRVEAWSSMERLARASVAVYPGGAEGWKQLGAALAEQGRFAEAADAIERSIRRNQDDPVAWKLRADAASALGRHQEAAEAWRRLVELAPVEAPVLLRALGEAELRADNLAGAIESLGRAHALAPEDLATVGALIQAHLRRGDAETAARLLADSAGTDSDDSVSLLPLRGPVLLRLAQQRLAEGAIRDALRLARELEQLGSLPAGDLFLAGMVASSGGDGTLAKTLFDRALRADPELLRKKHDLAQQLIEQGRIGEAVGQMQQILVARPDHPPSLFNLARAFTRAGRRQDAIAALRRGLAVQEDARARLFLNELLRGSSSGNANSSPMVDSTPGDPPGP